jgi:hypothetical protein
MTIRYWRFADTDLRPASTQTLLRFLGVEDAAVEDQRAAVAAWLAESRPSSHLAESLRQHGLLADEGAPYRVDQN